MPPARDRDAHNDGFRFDPKDAAVPDRPEIVCICGCTRFVDEMSACLTSRR
ncbi:hypothetical protein Ais01nite_14810 [Asanoa ishikariensis]|uniref:Uncharacterized protein n=1 Tax=Asanoa ishikariensis TaxID=137265 RepID=A0A1H3UIL1_9ACTN|nr:hypothetical protein Ais01nite_14810 [Asanoa ishikariensis]SDZ62157.1 hypothetical protein SAMN05421684_7392 [Asanoa ishikariensis]